MRLDVVALTAALPLLARARAAALAEEPAEQVAEVAEVEVEVLGAALRAVRAERVVLLALLGILEDLVRGLHFLEARLGLRVARVLVRVVLARELAVRLLDVVRARRLRDAEDVVEALSRRHC